jgi:hypothetical protein
VIADFDWRRRLTGEFGADCAAVVAPWEEISPKRMEQYDALGFGSRRRGLDQPDQNY